MDSQITFRVEPAVEHDVPLLLRMTRSLAEFENVLHRVTATEANLRDALFGQRPCAEAAIAYSGDEPAGMAFFFHTFSTFPGRANLYIEDLYIEPQWRGRGLGKRLMAHLARLAVARHCARLEWSVLRWNEQAIGFYGSLGGVPVDDWTVYRLSDAPLQRLAALS